MDLATKSKAEIDRRIERLVDRFGSFEVHGETVTNDPEFFADGKEMIEAGWIGDAGAWVTDDEGQALMIRHEDDPDAWGVPGGGHEPGETMAETARREVREETGVDCTLVDVNYARRRTVVLEPNPEERFHMLTVIFDASYDGGSISIDDPEILAAEWFAQLPETVNEFVEQQVATWDTDS